MSQENIEIIRRAHEAYERGNWDESVKDFDSEAIAYREVPDGAMFYGPEGMLQMVTDWLAGFDDFILTTLLTEPTLTSCLLRPLRNGAFRDFEFVRKVSAFGHPVLN